MPIPDFQTLMLPLLKLAADGAEHSLAECREPLAMQFGLSDEERKELLPSSRQPRFTNRVSWAKIYLERAKLLDKTRRAHFRISQRGRSVLQNAPERIDMLFLRQFPEFNEFRARPSPEADNEIEQTTETPEEVLETSYDRIRNDLAIDLLEQVKSASPDFLSASYLI